MRKRTADPAAAAGMAAEGAVDSLERGLELLRIFQGRGSHALSIAQMTTRMGLPKTTTQRLVGTLVSRGFLADSGDGVHYEPDVGALVVGHAFLASQSSVKAALPAMQRLAEQENVHVLLGIRERESILCLAHQSGTLPPVPALGVGVVMPLATTAMGRAWLWAQPAAVQAELMARIRAGAGEEGGRVMAAIYRAFQGMETEGYCVSMGDWISDSSGIATTLQLADDSYVVLGCEVSGLGAAAQRIASLGAPLIETASAIRGKLAHERAA